MEDPGAATRRVKTGTLWAARTCLSATCTTTAAPCTPTNARSTSSCSALAATARSEHPSQIHSAKSLTIRSMLNGSVVTAHKFANHGGNQQLGDHKQKGAGFEPLLS